MRRMSSLLTLTLAACMLLSLPVQAKSLPKTTPTVEFSAMPPATMDDGLMQQLQGSWIGRFHTPVQPLENLTYFDDSTELNILAAPDGPALLISPKSYEAKYLQPLYWRVSEGELFFQFNDMPWQASVSLRLDGENTLVGTYSQYGKSYETTFYRTANQPKRLDQASAYEFEKAPIELWMEQLRKHRVFSGQKSTIPYSYELYAYGKSQALLESAGLYEVAYRPYERDVDQMKALMLALSAKYRHDGVSGMPEKTDTGSIMEYTIEKGGIECRGQSAMLAEALRAFGYPAKVVMCIPYTDPCEDCHVVVHAWSFDLNQWVMLDPTYRLMPEDAYGYPLSIPQVRESLASGAMLYANTEAGHNGAPFSMDYYRAYMTKNMFRFSNPEKNSYEGEKATGNRSYMLMPKGYSLPYALPERITYDPDAFWAAPTGVEAPAKPAV